MGDAAVYDLATVVAERDALTQKLKASEAEVAQIGSYCQTLTDAKVELAAELGEAQAEVALRKSEVELFRDKLKARCDEVANLKAACAAKDAALSKALGYVDLDNDALISKCLAALKGTAGTGWIDATGAVESMALPVLEDGNAWIDDTPLPAAWVGKSVLIVVKP